MMLINLFINLYNVLKVKTLECVSVINKKCMSSPKIIIQMQMNQFFTR